MEVILGTISKVADNRELTVEISENVEIKVAPGMVTDLYKIPDQDKNIPANENKNKFCSFQFIWFKNNINEKLSTLEIIYSNYFSFFRSNIFYSLINI